MAALFADNDLQTEYVVERPKTAIIAIMLFIVLFIKYVISSLSLSLSLSLFLGMTLAASAGFFARYACGLLI